MINLILPIKLMVFSSWSKAFTMDWELHTVIGSVQDTDSLYKRNCRAENLTLQWLINLQMLS